VRRRLRILRDVIQGPSDVWLGIRMLAWSTVLPMLKHLVPLHILTRLMWPKRRAVTRAHRAAAVTFLARRIFRMRPFLRRNNCLERSLLTYRFLASEGLDPRLVLGARKADGRIRGHSWVLIDGRPVMDGDEAIDRFAPVAEFGANGARIEGEIRRLGEPRAAP
jgi:hypothetical protein